MQSVSDDNVWKRLLEKPRSELAVKGVFRLERCYIFWQGVRGLWVSNWVRKATDGWLLDRWHQKTIGACRMKQPSARKTAYWHEQSKVRLCTSVKNSECQQGDLILDPQRDIGYELFKQWTVESVTKNLFIWVLRSRRTVTICLNCASPNFLSYLLTYLLKRDHVSNRPGDWTLEPYTRLPVTMAEDWYVTTK